MVIEGREGLGAKKDALKKTGLKFRFGFFIVGLGLLLAFLYVKAVSPPQKDNLPPARASSAAPPPSSGSLVAGQAWPAKASSPKLSLLRIDLLDNPGLSQEEKSGAVLRSIFQPLFPAGVALPDKKEDKPKDSPPIEPEPPKVKAKLLGIMGKKADTPQVGLIKYAYLSFEGEIVIVKKGDLILDQFEVVEVGEETVEILVKETGRVEKLSLEKSAR